MNDKMQRWVVVVGVIWLLVRCVETLGFFSPRLWMLRLRTALATAYS